MYVLRKVVSTVEPYLEGIPGVGDDLEGSRASPGSKGVGARRRAGRSIAVVAALLGALLAAGLGCRSGPRPSPEERKEISKRETSKLYEAIVETYRARELSIELASEKFLLVRSAFRRVDDRLRRRFVARIVRLPGGASALRVRAEHQRRHGQGEDAVWKQVESKLLRKRAREAELELGRAIEERYRSK